MSLFQARRSGCCSVGWWSCFPMVTTEQDLNTPPAAWRGSYRWRGEHKSHGNNFKGAGEPLIFFCILWQWEMRRTDLRAQGYSLETNTRYNYLCYSYCIPLSTLSLSLVIFIVSVSKSPRLSLSPSCVTVRRRGWMVTMSTWAWSTLRLQHSTSTCWDDRWYATSASRSSLLGPRLCSDSL